MCFKPFFLLLIVVFIISCAGPADSGLSDGEIKVLTIKDGSILEKGTALPVTLIYNESDYVFDYLNIFLYDDTGREVAANKIERNSIENNRKREIVLPENLGKGIYHVKFELYKSDKMIFSTITNFFNESSSYKLNNIQSYPPNPAPGEKVILIADFTIDPSSNPYFRWIIGKNTVFEGFYSEGANKYNWKTPAIEGAYSVTVELFPFKPEDKVFEKFSSAISTNSAVLVSESNRMISKELSPEISYSTLYHFRGDITDSGYIAQNKNNFEIVGNPLPDFKGGIYGYYFEKDKYIEIPSVIIPFSKDGVLHPFSIKIKFLCDYSKVADPAENSAFFSSISESGNFNISLGQYDKTQYFCEIVSGSNKFTSKAFHAKGTSNSTINLTLSFYPSNNGIYTGDTKILPVDNTLYNSTALNTSLGNSVPAGINSPNTETYSNQSYSANSCTVVWVINGETVACENIPFIPRLAENSGKTIIGGGIYPLLIDEAGIYSRNNEGKNSVDPYCFSSYNSEIFGSGLIFAEGFDYSLNLSPLKHDGSAIINSGMAFLKPGGWVCAGTKIPLSGNVEISITGSCAFVIRDLSGNDIFSRNITGMNESFIISNIASGNYDIFILNNDKNIIKSVDNILITRAHSNPVN